MIRFIIDDSEFAWRKHGVKKDNSGELLIKTVSIIINTSNQQ